MSVNKNNFEEVAFASFWVFSVDIKVFRDIILKFWVFSVDIKEFKDCL